MAEATTLRADDDRRERLVQLLALAALPQAIRSPGGQLLIALGRQRNVAWWSWMNLSAFVVLAVWAFPGAGPVGVAALLAGLTFAGFLFQLGFLIALRLVRLADIAGSVWRPVVGTAVMAARRAHIRYTADTLPRGGQVRILTTDSAALAAIHEFLTFQRMDHRAAMHEHADTAKPVRR